MPLHACYWPLGFLITAVGYRDMYPICVAVSKFSLLMYWTVHGMKHGRKPGRDAVQGGE